MSRSYETLLLERPEKEILLLRLNRPDAANAINTRMARDLLEIFEELASDALDARCVVVTGAGSRFFCAGGDLKERRGMDDAQWRAQHVIVERAMMAMLDCPVPIIAAVNGAAYGGGCELVLNMDFAYSAAGAQFALTETSLGIIPGAGGTQNLPRAAGSRRAMEIILTARPFSADQAVAWGIVNEVFPADELLPAALGTARAIAGNAPLAIRQAKKSMQLGIEMDRRTGMSFEVEAYNRLVTTTDRHEGVNAFNERRRPNFRGC